MNSKQDTQGNIAYIIWEEANEIWLDYFKKWDRGTFFISWTAANTNKNNTPTSYVLICLLNNCFEHSHERWQKGISWQRKCRATLCSPIERHIKSISKTKSKGYRVATNLSSQNKKKHMVRTDILDFLPVQRQSGQMICKCFSCIWFGRPFLLG